MKKTQSQRMFDVDLLRISVIFLLIPYHAALTFTGMGDIYIKTPLSGLSLIPYLLITFPLDNFFMALLFFLSGIGVFYSLKRRNSRQFVQERVLKLFVPFLLGTIFLCPVQAYFQALYEGFNGSLIQFFPVFFSPAIVSYLGYAHLWFLIYLLFFSLISLPLFLTLQQKPETVKKISIWLLNGNRILFPWIWIFLLETFLRPYFPGKQIFYGDWANLTVYLSLFIFGYFYAAEEAIRNKLSHLKIPALIIVLISIPALLLINYNWLEQIIDLPQSAHIWGVIKGLYEPSMIILLLSVGRKYLNFPSRIVSYFSRASFTYYIFHMLPVSILTYITIQSGLHHSARFFITVAGSCLFILIIYEIINRFRNMFKKAPALS